MEASRARLGLGVKFYLYLTGGSLLILFGILFLIFFSLDKLLSLEEVTTDAIFIVGGVLIIRKAILDWTKSKIQEELMKKTQKKNPPSKSGTKQSR
jgi:hypothetical protein